MKYPKIQKKESVTSEEHPFEEATTTIHTETSSKEEPEMKETTAIVILMTGDVMHAEYLHGDTEFITEKIHDLEKEHTIRSISVKDGSSFESHPDKVSVTSEAHPLEEKASTIYSETNSKEEPEMEETTAIVTLMTGDVMHTEYLHGDTEYITEKIHNLEKGHSILAISVKDGGSFKHIFDAKDLGKVQFTR